MYKDIYGIIPPFYTEGTFDLSIQLYDLNPETIESERGVFIDQDITITGIIKDAVGNVIGQLTCTPYLNQVENAGWCTLNLIGSMVEWPTTEAYIILQVQADDSVMTLPHVKIQIIRGSNPNE